MKTNQQPAAIVTGASSGIGLGVTQALLERGWRVVGTSRTISKSKDLKPSPRRWRDQQEGNGCQGGGSSP
jgi:NAD(P)-dependent dehydrogenase (short-subunit alcohol dehydrogenase family)